MTGPEQHAATVREALAIAWPEGDHAEPNVFTEALAALDELVALAGRADELEAEREQLLAARENAYERLGRAIRQREDAEARVISVSEYGRKRAEAAEARADELQRERDGYAETIQWFWFKFAPGKTYADVDGKTIHELVEARLAEVGQARREADQLRAALRDAVDVAVWLTGLGEIPVDSAWPEMREKLNKAIALAGVQADTCDHDWKDMRNADIESGEWCPKCGAIRPGNVQADSKDAE